MRIIKIKVYTIEEHPNKGKCFNWIRNNWHDLNQYSVNEVIESIKALSDKIGGTYDYSIGQLPDRGQFISFKDYNHDLLYRLNSDDLPLTGVCWDIDLIIGLREGDANKVLKALHSDSEYQYSDKGLFELCKANQYEFYEDGSLV